MEKKAKYYKCCEFDFFIQLLGVIVLVLFAGLMSGLTLGLMSMSSFDLEVLAKSGPPKDRLHAGTRKSLFFLSVVKRYHLLLYTLLLSNAIVFNFFQALPVFLLRLVPDLIAILFSVTLILLFREVTSHKTSIGLYTIWTGNWCSYGSCCSSSHIDLQPYKLNCFQQSEPEEQEMVFWSSLLRHSSNKWAFNFYTYRTRRCCRHYNHGRYHRRAAKSKKITLWYDFDNLVSLEIEHY